MQLQVAQTITCMSKIYTNNNNKILLNYLYNYLREEILRFNQTNSQLGNQVYYTEFLIEIN